MNELPQEFMATLQWTGEYAADFHQAFSTHLCYLGVLYFEVGRDIEIEKEVVDNMAMAQTHTSYLECKVHQYNKHNKQNGNSTLSVDEVIDKLYTPSAKKLDLMVDQFRALAYNSDSQVKFEEIDFVKATSLSADILTLMMPNSNENYRRAKNSAMKALEAYRP